MDIVEVKKEFNSILKQNDIANYQNNITQLFLHTLNISKAEFLLLKSITKKQYKTIKKNVSLRASGYPLQYIVGNVEFFNNQIIVKKGVLIPRPETEQLCEMVYNNANNKDVLDLCCGSGCLGLGIAKNTQAKVTMVDISKTAIKITTKNARSNNLKVDIIKSDLFTNVNKKFDIIVSNPPYLTDTDMEQLQKEVCFEPSLALFGGDSGLEFYQAIINQAVQYLNVGGEIYFEYGLGQDKQIEKMLSKDFQCITIIKDYYNKNRFAYAKLKDQKC